MSRGRVFLSSVFTGLEGIRAAIHDLLERRGYSVWWAEGLKWPGRPTPSMTAAICFSGIDRCDYYLGIYPSRYGSDPLGMAFTELEYHHAAGRRMPRLLYQLADRTAQTPDQAAKQNVFLNLLRDPGVSPIQPRRCESTKTLLDAIERDLSKFGPRTCLDRFKPDFGEALLLWTASGSRNAARRSEIWADRIVSLSQAQRISLSHARTIGIFHLLESIEEFDFNDRAFLDGFDEYLSQWIGISAWTGPSGIFGQTHIAKARIGLAQLRGKYNSISNLAGSVTSGLYADREIAAANKWYQVYRRNGEAPKIRGAIALARGDRTLAVSCFEDVLEESNIDDANAALHLGYYGLALAQKGVPKRALKQADAALAIKTIPSNVLTRVWRTRAETLAITGDYSGAMEAADQAETIAKAADLSVQVRKARAARRRIRALAS